MVHNKWVLLSIAGMVIGTQAFAAGGQQGKARKLDQASHDSIGLIEASIRSHAYDEALERSKTALKRSPNDFRLWSLEGIVYSLQGSDQEALAAFGKALQLSPDYTVAMRGEVQLYYKSRDKRAIPLLKSILKLDEKDETAHEMLAVLEGRSGECEDAVQHFSVIPAAINTHPESLEVYGNCLVQTGQAEKAVPIFERLSELVPQSTYPRYDLAVVLVETKQNEAAIKVLDPLIAAGPDDADVLSLTSDAYEAVGNTPKAVALLRQAIVLSPTTESYYTSFAALCLDHESYQVGIDMIHAGLQRIPDDPSLYLSLGLLYAQLAKYDEAEAAFRNAERLDSKQSLSSYAIDLTEIQKNKSDETVEQVRSQLKDHPKSALLHYLLAKLIFSEGNDSGSALAGEALQSALMAVKLKPDMTEARDLLANMYTISGKYGLAVEQCRLALKTNPDDQTAIYHLIVALRHSEKPEDRAEGAALVKKLAMLQKTGRENETNRKRFRLVEPTSTPTSTSTQTPAPTPQ